MEAKVVAILSAGTPLKAAEVAEKAGITKDEADKIIKKLVKEGKAFSPVRCKYQAK